MINKSIKSIYLNVLLKNGQFVGKALNNAEDKGNRKGKHKELEAKFLKSKKLVSWSKYREAFDKIGSRLDLGETKDYFTFSVVRNPWDRIGNIYSTFNKQANSGNFEKFIDKLIDYVTKKNITISQYGLLYNDQDECEMSYIGKYEEIDKVYEYLSKHCSSNIKPVEPSGPSNYRSLYHEGTIRLIYDFFKKDCEKFGYNIDDYINLEPSSQLEFQKPTTLTGLINKKFIQKFSEGNENLVDIEDILDMLNEDDKVLHVNINEKPNATNFYTPIKPAKFLRNKQKSIELIQQNDVIVINNLFSLSDNKSKIMDIVNKILENMKQDSKLYASFLIIENYSQNRLKNHKGKALSVKDLSIIAAKNNCALTTLPSVSDANNMLLMFTKGEQQQETEIDIAEIGF